MSVSALVDDLFRHASGRIIAHLVHRLGPGRLELAEECVQDALLRALDVWPHRGTPRDPAAWLLQTARNRAWDILRRERNLERLLVERLAPGEGAAAPSGAMARSPNGTQAGEPLPLLDEELLLLFLCCHPMLTPDARVALTLRLACGFDVEEIARALLAKPEAVAQRLVRAKRTLRDADVRFELEPVELAERLPSVLDALYLLFAAGHQAAAAEGVVRRELCEEAIRMLRVLAREPLTAGPPTCALLALTLLHASRLPERGGEDVRLLERQDRTRWDRARIAEGLIWLECAADGNELSDYHLEAGIAAQHAIAPTWEETDWLRILRFYDLLAGRNPGEVVALNRAVALHMAQGPEAAAPLFDRLLASPRLAAHFPAHVAGARHAATRGDAALAAARYRHALSLPCSGTERRFIEERLRELESGL